jgi:hypothetical protein
MVHLDDLVDLPPSASTRSRDLAAVDEKIATQLERGSRTAELYKRLVMDQGKRKAVESMAGQHRCFERRITSVNASIEPRSAEGAGYATGLG